MRFDSFFIPKVRKNNIFSQNSKEYFSWTYTFSEVKIQNIGETSYFCQKWQNLQSNLNVLNFLDKFVFNHFFIF